MATNTPLTEGLKVLNVKDFDKTGEPFNIDALFETVLDFDDVYGSLPFDSIQPVVEGLVQASLAKIAIPGIVPEIDPDPTKGVKALMRVDAKKGPEIAVSGIKLKVDTSIINLDDPSLGLSDADRIQLKAAFAMAKFGAGDKDLIGWVEVKDLALANKPNSDELVIKPNVIIAKFNDGSPTGRPSTSWSTLFKGLLGQLDIQKGINAAAQTQLDDAATAFGKDTKTVDVFGLKLVAGVIPDQNKITLGLRTQPIAILLVPPPVI